MIPLRTRKVGYAFRYIHIFIALVIGFSSLSITDLKAQNLLVAWDFNGKEGNETEVDASFYNTGLQENTSYIRRGSGLNPTKNADRFSANDFEAIDETEALEQFKYFSVSVHSTSNYTVEISQLKFNFVKSLTGPNKAFIRSSKDGFSSNLASFDIQNTEELFDISFEENRIVLDASEEVEIRIYTYAGWSSRGTAGFEGDGNDIEIIGKVNQVIVPVDEEAPIFLNDAPKIDSLGFVDASIQIQLNEKSKVYWLLFETDSDVDLRLLQDAMNYENLGAISGGYLNYTPEMGIQHLYLNNLDAFHNYYIYLVAVDESENWQNEIKEINFKTRYARSYPELDGSPTYASLTKDSVSFWLFTEGDADRIYYLISPEGINENLSTLNVVHGLDENGDPLISDFYGQMQLTDRFNWYLANVNNLIPNTTYQIYIVTESPDVNGDFMPTPRKFNFTTKQNSEDLIPPIVNNIDPESFVIFPDDDHLHIRFTSDEAGTFRYLFHFSENLVGNIDRYHIINEGYEVAIQEGNNDLSIPISPGYKSIPTYFVYQIEDNYGNVDPSFYEQLLTRAVVINEFDPHTENGKDIFIEIFDGGIGNVPLDGWTVLTVNIGSDKVFREINLDGYRTDANGFFLILNDDSEIEVSSQKIANKEILQCDLELIYPITSIYTEDHANFILICPTSALDEQNLYLNDLSLIPQPFEAVSFNTQSRIMKDPYHFMNNDICLHEQWTYPKPSFSRPYDGLAFRNRKKMNVFTYVMPSPGRSNELLFKGLAGYDIFFTIGALRKKTRFLDVFGDFYTQGATGATVENGDAFLLKYDETKHFDSNNAFSAVPSLFDEMEVGKGYFFYMLEDQSIVGGNRTYPHSFSYNKWEYGVDTFEEQFKVPITKTNNYTVSNEFSGFNLLANPYPYYLLSKYIFRKQELTSEMDVYPNIWVWNPSHMQYDCYYDGLFSTRAKRIKPGQAFWVKAKRDANFIFDPSYYTNIDENWSYKEVDNIVNSKFLTLNLKSADRLQTVHLQLIDQNKDVYNTDYLMANIGPHLRMYFEDQSGNNYAIQQLQDHENCSATLVVENVSGFAEPAVIKLDTLANLQNYEISLIAENGVKYTKKDLLEGIAVDVPLEKRSSLQDSVFTFSPLYSTKDNRSEKSPYSKKKYFKLQLKRLTNTAVEHEALPQNFRITSVYPNPFNPTTQICFDLPKSETVNLSVFNVLGKKVYDKVYMRLEAGSHQLKLDAANWSNGVYYIRLQAGNQTLTSKVSLIK